MVEKFPTVLEKLPQVLRGDFFDSHCTSLRLLMNGRTPSIFPASRRLYAVHEVDYVDHSVAKINSFKIEGAYIGEKNIKYFQK